MPRGFTGSPPQQRWLKSNGVTPFVDIAVRVVTPMFGGGIVAREVDRSLPIRGQSVRGMLRFWWRACKSTDPAYPTAADLFAAEANIWGSTNTPSKVQVTVQVTGPGAACPYGAIVGNAQSPLGYGLFPFQADNNQPEAVGLRDVEFTLRCSAAPWVTDPAEFAALQMHVEAACWAWLMFGGVGSRTRRGCGSLFCLTDDARFRPPEQLMAVAAWLKRQAATHLAPGTRQSWTPPALTGGAFVTKSQGPLVTTQQAWSGAIEHFRKLRQEPGIGRNPGVGHPGRSFWPEPDSVREAFNLPNQGHVPVHPARPFFPRADFGLPIIFQQIAGNPSINVYRNETEARFASPFILKALAVSETQAVPLVLLLNSKRIWDVPGVEMRVGATRRPVTASELGTDVAKIAALQTTLPPFAHVNTVRVMVLRHIVGEWASTIERLP